MSLTFFKERATTIDPKAEEVSFSFGTVEENLYDFTTLDPLYRHHLLQLRARYFPDIPLAQIEGFSFQRKDGVIYQEDKLMLLLNGAQQDCFLYPEVGVFNPHPDYCLNLFLDSGRRSVKFYDLDVELAELVAVPDGSTVITHCGVGRGEDPRLRDIYFLHPSYQQVLTFYEQETVLPPQVEFQALLEDTTVLKTFGVAFDATTHAIKKIKFYYYPHDPTLTYCIFDE